VPGSTFVTAAASFSPREQSVRGIWQSGDLADSRQLSVLQDPEAGNRMVARIEHVQDTSTQRHIDRRRARRRGDSVAVQAEQMTRKDPEAGNAIAAGISDVGELAIASDDDPARGRLQRRISRVEHTQVAVASEPIGAHGAGVRGAAGGFGDDYEATLGERETERRLTDRRNDGSRLRDATIPE
jgi:hypothetical protein